MYLANAPSTAGDCSRTRENGGGSHLYSRTDGEGGTPLRVALKIAYDGRGFHGFARQPDVLTVEGEVLFALGKSGLVEKVNAANVRGASRTDAGVSALGNVIAFDADVVDDSVVGRFNDAAKDVWAWARSELPPGYDPRRARQRWYRYLVTGDHDIAILRDAAKEFVGPHEYRAFASPEAGRTRRHVDSVDAQPESDGILVDVRAPSFLRGMVRRIVAAILAVERGDATLDGIRDSLTTGTGPDLGIAPAEPLVLMDVDLGFPFRPVLDRATRERITARASNEAASARFWRDARLHASGPRF